MAGASHLLQRHVSPDGQLTFLVERTADGDVLLGFEGLPWHTHPEILFSDTQSPQNIYAAISSLIDELLGNRIILAVLRIDGKIADAWIADEARVDCF